MSHLLEVRGLTTVFHTPDGNVPAVNEISFHIAAGEILGVVGESGCGKSVTSLSLLRLITPPGATLPNNMALLPFITSTLSTAVICGITPLLKRTPFLNVLLLDMANPLAASSCW